MRLGAVRVLLRVAPGSRRAGVVGRHGEGWKVRVTAPPERGRANDEVTSLIANSLGVASGSVRLVAGASSRDKVVEVSGLEANEVERRLEQAGREAR